MSFAFLYLHYTLDKNSNLEALYDYSCGKIKSKTKSLGKENEKNGLKKKKNPPFCQAKKKTLLKATKALGLSVDSLNVLFFSGTLSAFNSFGVGFAFAFTFGIFFHYYVVVLTWTALSKVKNVLQCDAFPGKSWSIVIDTRRSCFSIGSRFY